ncbi:MAG: DUF4314 domain-containing protein [Lachnospiraceae bacterium]|nr:DUF4314 domain-containing protein [Lachnospiraceae bacterium]
MGYPVNKAEYLRLRYPHGTRLKLTEDVADEFTPKKAGDIFMVDYIDDAGQIHGNWQSGGSMALIPEIDKFEIVT